jgi:hypothetical protein
MKYRLIPLLLCGSTCLPSVGCLRTPNHPGADGAAQWAEVPAASSSPASGSSVSIATVEPRIARLVQRTVDRLAATHKSHRGQSTSTTTSQRHSAVDHLESPEHNPPPQGHQFASAPLGRGETLRVTSAVGGFCAAVSIAPRLAVTALHCVGSLCESVKTTGGKSLVGCRIVFETPTQTAGEARVVATSEDDLLALLDLDRPQPQYGALNCDDPRAKDRVYTVSHPNGDNWAVSYGWLTRDPIPLEWVEGKATRVLVAEIPTRPGSSGGGLFDNEDRLVGVQIARWSQWTTDFGKAAFIQSNRVFYLAGRYCLSRASSACMGLRCASTWYDVWNFDDR